MKEKEPEKAEVKGDKKKIKDTGKGKGAEKQDKSNMDETKDDNQ